MTQRIHQHYDLFSIVLHWAIVIFVLGLFFSGLWMVELDYYHAWYYRAPWWHTSFGVVSAIFLMARLLWIIKRPPVAAIDGMPAWQQRLAISMHRLLDVMLLVIVISGYFIVTAKGDGLAVFDAFILPAVHTFPSAQASWIGLVHQWAAYILIAMATLHMLAALKHHLINKDFTLKRMFLPKKGDAL
jgi:cytochrome b561